MDDAANNPPNTPPLFQQTWTDDTPLDQIPEEHRARVAAEREEQAVAAKEAEARKAEEAAAARTAKPASRKAGDRTAARAPKKTAARAGARPKRLKADTAPEPEPTDVHLVMLTSRVSDVDGRFVARRRLVLSTQSRAGELIVRGQAREATADEIKSAAGALPKIR